jgi:hypothetical protein
MASMAANAARQIVCCGSYSGAQEVTAAAANGSLLRMAAMESELLDLKTAGDGEWVGLAHSRVEYVEVEMHISNCIIERSSGEELSEVGRNTLDGDYGYARSGQKRDLTWVKIPGTQKEGRFLADRLNARHGPR